jgi:hypothetical protein
MTRLLAVLVLILGAASAAPAQTISQRGFVDGRSVLFPQKAPNDDRRFVGDLLVREELFVRPAEWIEFAGGLDLRANSYDQVDNEWRLDLENRTIQRPLLALRRASTTITAGPLTLEAGKIFVRWARADIINPTDRFAPRDFLTVIDTDFLPVIGAHPTVQFGSETIEAVWLAQPTPSRLPLFTQRWTALPNAAAGIPLVDGGLAIPERSQQGIRWRHAGSRFESALSVFDGVNHLPNIAVLPLFPVEPGGSIATIPASIRLTRVLPELRTYGADLAVPTGWFTFKGEAAYFDSPDDLNDEYVLYVLELERQIGNWIVDGGYAGESVTERREQFSFNPERGLAKSIVGKVAYVGDPGRTFSVESAVKQTGKGVYVKGEFSEALNDHWRLTVAGIGIGGNQNDFLGQYRRNSNVSASLRFSF